MSEELKRVADKIGTVHRNDCVVLRGNCPFCGDKVTFRQRTYNLSPHHKKGSMVSVQCEGCNGVLSYSIEEHKLYPNPEITGLENLPEEIQKYYDEGLRCLSSNSPNGAVTLFRKVIHAIGIHYKIAKKNDDKKLYEIINELHDGGHIVVKLRDTLLGIKDIGNDGAHINENEPDIEQANRIRKLIDTVLKSTVICDSDLEFVKDLHSKRNDSSGSSE